MSKIKENIGFIFGGIGLIAIGAVIVKGFLIGFYDSDLIWMIPTFIGGIIFLFIAKKVLPDDEKKTDL